MGWDQLQSEAFLLMAIFCRVGSALMTLPAFGETAVPSRVKLILALLITLGMMPVVSLNYPPVPESLGALVGIAIGEIAVGIIMGMVVRLFMLAINVAGTLIATQGGLAFAQSFDPTIGIQGALVASLLSMAALVLIFQADLHHVMLIGVSNSYSMFPVGAALNFGDLAAFSVRTFTDAFRLGVQLAAPFIAFSLVFYTALGAVSKLMPQLQIFFLAMPVNILCGFSILMLTIGAVLLVFLERFEAFLLAFFG